MREKTIEAKLVQTVRSMGGLALNLQVQVSMECLTVWCSCPAAKSPSLS